MRKCWGFSFPEVEFSLKRVSFPGKLHFLHYIFSSLSLFLRKTKNSFLWRFFRQLQLPIEAGDSGVVFHGERSWIIQPPMVPFSPSNLGLSNLSIDLERFGALALALTCPKPLIRELPSLQALLSPSVVPSRSGGVFDKPESVCCLFRKDIHTQEKLFF